MIDEASANAIQILMVEDNPSDVRLTQEALKSAKMLNNMHVVEDGEAALDFLYQRGMYSMAPRPDLVLLDLNLPKLDGREVLAIVKADDTLKSIPVVILTTSQAEEDIVKAYNLNANSYVTKPVDLEQFTQIVKTIENFWLTVVALPVR